jgi:competence protein ComEC
MPRAGWLALGTVGAALLGEQIVAAGPLAVAAGPLALAAAALAGVAVATVALGAGRPAVAVAGVGVALLLLRIAAGAWLAPPAAAPTASEVAADSTDAHLAVVISLGGTDGGRQRAVVELLPPEPPARVYAWLPRYPALAARDQIEFDGTLEPAPDLAGLGEYLARSAIELTVFAHRLERIGGEDSPLAALAGLRFEVADLVARSLPQPQAGLGTALTIGLRERVGRDVADDFRVAGLSHIVAISGFHIALLGGMVSALLRGLNRRPRSLLVLAAIVAYAVLAGASASVVRAALMAAVVLLARESGRRGESAAALGLAVVGILLFEPATVGDVGFQLSVAATAGILAWASRLGESLRTRLPGALSGWVADVMAVSLAAQAATLPLVLLHFGQLSLVAPLSNLLVAPIVAPAMLATALTLVAGVAMVAGLPALAVVPLTLPAVIGLGVMTAIADACASLPLASVALPPPLNLVAAGVATACLAAVAHRWRVGSRPSGPASPSQARSPGRRSDRRLRLVGAAAALGLAGALFVGGQPDGRLHVTVLDVGQGDAILVEGPRGGRLLIDTGPDPDRLLAVLDARLPAWDRRLDMVIVTHPHEDHVGGLALLLDRYRIGAIAEPGMVGLGPGDAAYRRRMAELERQPTTLSAGDRLELDGARIDVLWPPPGRVPLHPADGGTAVNNVSLVLELTYGQRRMLLTGDIEQAIDPVLLATPAAGELDAPIDVLKVAHHGSATASTDAFLARVRPAIAVISAGWGNPYGHPSPQTIARLRATGAEVMSTDADGSVEVTTNGTDLLVTASGGRPHPARPVALTPPGPGFCPVPTLPATVATSR